MDIVNNEKVVGHYDVTIKNETLYLDKIYINKEFRGLGIGSKFINNLSSMYNVKYIQLLPKPFEDSEKIVWIEIHEALEKEDRLRSFYKKLGFKNIPNSKYMVKKIRA